jgi:BlaI family transcriptional regulator, penicillinase repressor
MRTKSPTLTPQELEIMKVVWQRPHSTVRDVYESLRTRRKVAYTTVMTMMNILEQKRYLKKSRDERAFIYRAARPRKQVLRAMVRDFVDRVFNGAAKPLVVHLIQDEPLSDKELREIARLIQEAK